MVLATGAAFAVSFVGAARWVLPRWIDATADRYLVAAAFATAVAASVGLWGTWWASREDDKDPATGDRQKVEAGNAGFTFGPRSRTRIRKATFNVHPPAADPPKDRTVPEQRAPGALPPIWNVPVRNQEFVGRDEMLDQIHVHLTAGNTTVVQALHGWGGVGKTQLAVEYAHRYADEYDVVWWIPAEKIELIGEQFTDLAVACGLAAPETGPPAAATAVKAHLRGRNRWLLVFDNAEEPADLRDWLPEGPGRVLITSRNRAWGTLAKVVQVDVFSRDESVRMLLDHRPDLTEPDANRLADKLGDLPLAIAQGAGLLAETGMPLADYEHHLDTHAAEIANEGCPDSYPTSLAAAVRTTRERLLEQDTATAQLLELCAFLAPEPIPLELFTRAPSNLLDEPLASTVASSIAFHRALVRLERYGLVRIDPRGPVLHRLVQAVQRDLLPEVDQHARTDQIRKLLVAADPWHPDDPSTWESWAALLPHLLASRPAESDNPRLRSMACGATWYLLVRADIAGGKALAEQLHARWLDKLGPDDNHTLWAANSLARAWTDLGQYQKARDLDEDSLTRRRRMLGEDNENTLVSANNLAIDLRRAGELAAARELDEDTLDRRRRLLGEDHPDTLTSANNLAVALREAGELAAARELDEDTLARRRRLLGEDHPDTLRSANNLAADLREAGELAAARELDEDTLARRRRVLGEDHPETLRSARNLAADLRALEAAVVRRRRRWWRRGV
ncbi:MAG: FxSxx-COOH system tetratricopeptide repeat protein [Mycobacteriales bacterium]